MLFGSDLGSLDLLIENSNFSTAFSFLILFSTRVFSNRKNREAYNLLITTLHIINRLSLGGSLRLVNFYIIPNLQKSIRSAGLWTEWIMNSRLLSCSVWAPRVHLFRACLHMASARVPFIQLFESSGEDDIYTPVTIDAASPIGNLTVDSSCFDTDVFVGVIFDCIPEFLTVCDILHHAQSQVTSKTTRDVKNKKELLIKYFAREEGLLSDLNDIIHSFILNKFDVGVTTEEERVLQKAAIKEAYLAEKLGPNPHEKKVKSLSDQFNKMYEQATVASDFIKIQLETIHRDGRIRRILRSICLNADEIAERSILKKLSLPNSSGNSKGLKAESLAASFVRKLLCVSSYDPNVAIVTNLVYAESLPSKFKAELDIACLTRVDEEQNNWAIRHVFESKAASGASFL